MEVPRMSNISKVVAGGFVTVVSALFIAPQASADTILFYPSLRSPGLVNRVSIPVAVPRTTAVVDRVLTSPAVIAPSYVRTMDLEDYYENLGDHYEDLFEESFDD
jgi:hypothetical protein